MNSSRWDLWERFLEFSISNWNPIFRAVKKNYHTEKCQGGQVFKCDLKNEHGEQCDYQTPIKRHLLSHKQQKHEKMFTHCSICGYKTKCQDAMERHRFERHDLHQLQPCLIREVSDEMSTATESSSIIDDFSSQVSSSSVWSTSVDSSIIKPTSVMSDMELDHVMDTSSRPNSPVAEDPYGEMGKVCAFRTAQVSDNSIQLKWRRPISTRGEVIHSFNLQVQILHTQTEASEGRAENAVPIWMDLLQVQGGKHEATVTALECNIDYRFRICAVMENGRGPWNEIGPLRTGKFILNPRFQPPRNMLKPNSG
ncbi:Oidioi.mRNA.OKI2018_I69.chr1.g3898.t1.cds [Oikopleura dioica]|uniref:Oidioi.mRNA.OKI2018_I69.chr1.g3898.t1.cds n=1 Tax=Oikopleura dioica TaxID=34765 RepID=A0ABN7SVK8_OIKDI|nr:Oidioi.mRNA.OKI2018_I69.chr1.g3898.t1.cds [Oikopleura dioica]